MGNKIIFRQKYRFRVINAKRCAFEKYFWKCKCFSLTINWKGEKWHKKRKNSKKHTKLFSVGKGTSRYRIETHEGSSESPRPIVGTRRHSANPINLNYLKIGPTFDQFNGRDIFWLLNFSVHFMQQHVVYGLQCIRRVEMCILSINSYWS